MLTSVAHANNKNCILIERFVAAKAEQFVLRFDCTVALDNDSCKIS